MSKLHSKIKNYLSILASMNWAPSLIGGFVIVCIAIVQQRVFLNQKFSEMNHYYLVVPFIVGFVVGTLIGFIRKIVQREKSANLKLSELYQSLDRRLEESLLETRETERQLFHSQRMEAVGSWWVVWLMNLIIYYRLFNLAWS